MHTPIILWWAFLVFKAADTNLLKENTLLIPALIMMQVVAWIVYRVWEVPMRVWLRNKLDKRPAPSPATRAAA